MNSDTRFGAQAIALWEELTGKSVDSTSYTFRVGGEQFDLYQANKRVQQAIAVADDLTITLVVKTLAEQFAQTEKFTLADILVGNDRLQARLELAGRMNALFSDAACLARNEEFYRYCEGALAHYRDQSLDATSDERRRFVRESACFVGLDAFHSIERLTRLMICDGAVSHSCEAKVSRLVFAFDSIEELITHSRQIPVGFSLCVILAPSISNSYFVMVVNTGGRILLLTDKGNYQHPLQELRMQQRNDRYNLRRMEGSHFPYGLLGIQWGDNGRQAHAGAAGTDLMVSDSGLWVLGSLSDLNDWDLLWLHLFIDQCRHRYFDQQMTEPKLATGSMIRLHHKWAADQVHLPVPADFELHLDTRSSAELNTAFLHTLEPAFAERYNPNLWMEERFAAQVPDDCLYLPAGALNHETPLLAFNGEGGGQLARQDITRLPFWEVEKLPTLDLQPIARADLATPERIIRDAHLLARHNQSEAIARLANEDYQARQDAIGRWFYKAAARYLPQLIDSLLDLDHARVFVDTPAHQAALQLLGRGRLVMGGATGASGMTQVVRVLGSYRSISIEYLPVRAQTPMRPGKIAPSLAQELKLIGPSGGYYRCAVDRQESAQLFIRLDMSTVLDLMTVTGLCLEEIPQELRHRGVDTYAGNSILDRIDPLSTISNPWEKLRLHYVLPVSLKAFKAHRRRRGLPTPKAADLRAFAEAQAQALRHRQHLAETSARDQEDNGLGEPLA